MGIFSWLAGKAHSGMTRAVTKQIVHILWANYQALSDQDLPEAEKWQHAVAMRFTSRGNRDGLLFFEGAKSSITDFESACSVVCEVEIRHIGPVMDGESSMREFGVIHDTIDDEIASIRGQSGVPK